MGLAQVKTRRKIGKDPNNTKWTKDTDSFGQKILRSQGWEPGQYLGAKDAAHAVHHTAANASFIRVALKDDMLGLGFKQARDDRVTGMDVFSDLLGRLNGKSTEAIDKDRQARAQLKSTLYCDTKFGPMRFVSGGWLVGDQVREDPDAATKKEEAEDIKMEDVPAAVVGLDKKSKKRKVEESSDESESSSEDEKARKKRRKEDKKAAKKLKAAEVPDSDDASATDKKDKKRKSKTAKEDVLEDTQDDAEKKSKKEKKEKRKKGDKDGDNDEDSDDKLSKKKHKEKETDAEKAARKEEKRRRKEEKRAKKEASRESSSTPATTSTSTPTASGTSTPVLRGHHAVRSRWIAQKKMATMDDKALNQIFMIKSQS